MKIAVLADTHFGIKNDSEHMRTYSMGFLRNSFFPYLEANGIQHVIHVGDLMDRRKFVSYVTYNAVMNEYIKPCMERKIETIITAGNHDCYFKNTNDINSPMLLLTNQPGFKVFSEAATISLPDGTPVCLIPWIPDDAEAKQKTLQTINTSAAKYAFGHLELNGFQYSPGIMCETGHDKSMVEKFEGIYSGHFHFRHSGGKVYYLGTPYQMSFDDIGITKGFHVFETDTGIVEFIPNKETLFDRIHYPNTNDPIVPIADVKSTYAGKFVKLYAPALKTDPVLFDRYMTELVHCAADLKVIEYNHEDLVSSSSDEPSDVTAPSAVTNTLSLLMNEIESGMPASTSESIKVKTRQLMRELHAEIV